MKARLIILHLFLLSLSSIQATKVYAQPNPVLFNELDSLQRISKKPVVVFIHTDWCRYCGAMKNATLKKKDVIELLNEKFYFVSFNAEQKEDVNFNGHTFVFKPNGANTGVHELAMQLGMIKGELSYPTLCFLNDKAEIIYQHSGFLYANELEKILRKLAK